MTNHNCPRSHFDRLMRRLRILLCIVAGVSAFSIQVAADTLPGVKNIAISKAAFEPQEVTVAPGTKVIWTNHDEMPHTVTSREKVFASKGLDTDDSFEHT